jgi:dGTPase
MRRQITAMVEDVIGYAQQAIREERPESADDVRKARRCLATFSEEMAVTDRQIKKMLFSRIYRHPEVMRVRANAASILTDLYHAYMDDPQLMRGHYWVDRISTMPESARARHVADYLAGMTDNYAIDTHRRLFDHTPELR